jgi:glutaredoxin
MPTICPKCRHTRPAETTAPDWQCPACGVAYAKAGAAMNPTVEAGSAGYRAKPGRSSHGGLPWRLMLTAVAVIVGVYAGHQAHLDKRGPGELFGGADAADDAAMRQLAGTVRAEQVVMYSTTECGYCTLARSWMTDHGFAFTECNMSLDSRCEDAFRALGATGTPYLIVRGPRGEHHMKEGFDSDEFIKALSS